jgi:replication factor A1
VPVCQCVQIKTLGSSGEGAPERYRLVLSDVKNFVQSMLATRKCHGLYLFWVVTHSLAEANHVVHEGKLKKGSIVRLKQYQANAVKGKRFVSRSSNVNIIALTKQNPDYLGPRSH